MKDELVRWVIRLTLAGCIVVVILMLGQLTGCAGSKPYAEAAVKYAYPNQTDWYLRPDRYWACGDPYQLDFEIGYETPSRWSAGIYHESFIFCGKPFNNRSELHETGFIVKKTWGGIR